MFNNVSRCSVSRATIGDSVAADRLSDHDSAAGIGNNAAGISDNAAGISDNAAEIGDIASKVIPC